MEKMKAIVKENRESNDFFLTEVSIPQIEDSEILVQVKAIGVGIQDGYFFPKDMHFPYPIGIEGSGVIEKIGKNTTGFKKGTKSRLLPFLKLKAVHMLSISHWGKIL